MKKPYEEHGIPSESWLEYSDPPNYAIINEININEIRDEPFGIKPGEVRLWGAANYWTALEAALLLAGVAPDDIRLYDVEQENVPDEGYGTKYFVWTYAPIFDAARDYLFLFERSELAPKASPIEWVKYFTSNRRIYSAFHKYGFDSGSIYCGRDWRKYFSDELSKINQTEDIKKPESTRKTENLLRALTAIAVDAYSYNSKDAKSKVPQDIVDAMSQHGVDFSSRTIRDWLKEGASLLEINLDKD